MNGHCRYFYLETIGKNVPDYKIYVIMATIKNQGIKKTSLGVVY